MGKQQIHPQGPLDNTVLPRVGEGEWLRTQGEVGLRSNVGHGRELEDPGQAPNSDTHHPVRVVQSLRDPRQVHVVESGRLGK